jgi:CheY-specific phosphatase CheX
MNTLPPEVAEAITTAAITTLRELLQIELVSEGGVQRGELTHRVPVVVATIQLICEPTGALSLVLSAQAATNLAARYLPAGTSLMPEMIDDVVGEFANVIAGQTKTLLKGTRHHFLLSTPVVERVANWDTHSVLEPAIVIRLHSEIGDIMLQGCLPG